MKRPPLIFVLFLTTLALIAASCSSLPGDVSPEKELEITDSTGHTVLLDSQPQRIAIAGKATVMVQDAVFLFQEASQRVIALENRKQSVYVFLPVVDPNIPDKTLFEVNVGPEQIAAVQPDLVLLKSFMAEKLGDPLEQLGIPVVYLNLETPQVFYEDIKALGQVFGDPARAEEINDFYKERVARVQELIGEAPEKPGVLVLRYNQDGGEVAFSVPPASWLQTTLVEMAGGTPVWKELSTGGGWTVVNLEQVAAWDPEMIFLVDYSGGASAVVDELKLDPVWSNLQAVQNDSLYAFAFDFYSWDQPDTRWILGLQWLATKIHPELSDEIDILEEVNAFYGTLYSLDQETIAREVLPILTGDLP